MTSPDGKRGLLGPGGRLADADKRSTRNRSIKLSDNDLDWIDQARGTTPRAQFIREGALEKAARELGVPVGELDTAQRSAPRSANYKDRQREEGRES